MAISKKADYALRMLEELAHSEGTPVSVRTIAERNDVPYSFARSIQHELAKSGLVQSVRGSHGGMRFAVDPETLTLRDVVEAVQGKVVVEDCYEEGEQGGPCARISFCPFHPIWCGANALLASYLSSITIAEVARGEAHPALPAYFFQPDAFAAFGKAAGTARG